MTCLLAMLLALSIPVGCVTTTYTAYRLPITANENPDAAGAGPS